jgi:hypothetical protein
MVKYLLLALALLLAAPSPASAQGAIPCNQWTLVTATGVVLLTQIIPPSPNQRIGICGYAMIASVAAASMQLHYGTGTNCGTGTTDLSVQVFLLSGGVLVNRSDYITERVPVGNAICYDTDRTGGNTGNMEAVVYWTYF